MWAGCHTLASPTARRQPRELASHQYGGPLHSPWAQPLELRRAGGEPGHLFTREPLEPNIVDKAGL